MPLPSEVHIDQPLTDFSVAVGMQMESQFVARRAFPVAPSPKQSDKYYIYDKDDLLRSDAQKFAGKGETAGRDFHLSNTSFFIDVYGLHHDIGRHERGNADAALDPEEDAAQVLMQDHMINEDVQFAATAMVTSAWDNSETGGTNFTRWDDAASTPIEDLEGGNTTVLQNTGRKPNKAVLGYQTWAAGLKHHPDILDRVKYSQRGVITEELVASILGLDEVLVASAVRNTADEGLTESDSFIVGDDALLIHTNAGGLRVPTAGRTFIWTEYGPNGVLASRYDIEHKSAFPRVEVFRSFDHKVTSSALGYFFDDTIT